ncbi:hypothetical protein DFH07DRAFT_871091 [Mycena maculata]|uniref:MULE transposase domain-containing protein n=1 Tax=Mycena maculata TaxID=230809 RepID=A0AAD7I0U1_9AGAR|nr:hypothetical protein DFH07DRAFT_871091 [Mycena maculata]
MFCVLRDAFGNSSDVNFHGSYAIADDPLVSEKERVQLTIREIWKVSGYRFRVRDNKIMKTGYKTRLLCCQDADRKQAARPSAKEGAQRRDTVGMKRYKCQSRLRVTCRESGDGEHVIVIRLQHKAAHIHYYDVKMPADAIAMLRANLEWTTPVSMVGKIQASFPHVTAAQVHSAWTEMSEILWKRDKNQLTSAEILLREFTADCELFEVPREEGVEQLCWGMKKIAGPLRGKIVEIGFDATCFPLLYCLLSTASSIQIGKRKKALTNWAKMLRNVYGIDAEFIHLDKDMAGIGMGIDTWPIAKVQLCYWHLDDAVETRLAKNKLSTTPYNAVRAHAEFPFIDMVFKPSGRADHQEYEGGRFDETIRNDPTARTDLPPDTLFLRLKPLNGVSTTSESESPAVPGVLQDPNGLNKENSAPTVTDSSPSVKSSHADVENTTSRSGTRVFCPSDLRKDIIVMMETHFCAHPLIPGYAPPNPPGIKRWAVKQMYEYCVNNDLPEVWAYLWENWYRDGRWQLWARAPHPQIPRLKTTMMVESHWRRIKRDFLHHFNMPRVDLLVWILVKKLAPRYYTKLDHYLEDKGRFRQLPSWRKDFKAAWKKALKTPITTDPDRLYRYNTQPDNRFLICKHLVQGVQPVSPLFFLEANRNRTSPFWAHPSLIPLNSTEPLVATEVATRDLTACAIPGPAPPHDTTDQPNDDHDDVVDTTAGIMCQTFTETLTEHIRMLREFTDGLQYQIQFQDHRMLETLERDGAGFLRLARNCLDRERRANSSRSTANAMFYRTRPRPADRNT